jgi:hypothetical protein
MNTKTLIALHDMYYEGDHKAGETFEAREEHIDLLIRVGAATVKQNDPKAKRYERRDLRAED